MNILCLDQFGELGGAQRCLLDLIPGMAARGWSVHLAAPGDGQLAKRAAELHATVHPIRCGPYSSGKKTLADMARFAAETPRLVGELRGLVSRYGANLIYVNGPRLLPAVALSVVPSARQRPRVLFHSHSLLDGLARRVAGRSLAMAKAAVVASCHFVAAPLLPYCGDRGVRVVYNGVRQMSPTSRSPVNGEFRIGVIGRISPEKGQAEFLRAARILHKSAPQCVFPIYGAPLFSDPVAMRYGAVLEALAEDLPVEFAGWTEDVDSALATLDLLVVPSAPVDATPRVILEAFAAGVPVLAFASGGIPEIVEHGATGFLVEERTARALAFAMRDLLREPRRLREVAEKARTKARDEFSLERYRAQMNEAIEAAL
ncbi:MAG TPA: glycosyltransferase family 4 protein [Bryobacteraceae bacterium]|jgi:glycosyltransferase involved in cell wall biosynthesis|nr:glycosyltransferase family 4 protein [Bryobacteraceae bacterium]